MEVLLPLLPAAPQLSVVPEFIHSSVGRPDLALKRPGEPARAFIELKSLEKSIDGASWKPGSHDRRQFDRFAELAHWAISNFHEIRLYERKEPVGYAVLVPLAALDPARTDAAADALIEKHDASAALKLLERLAQASRPTAADAQELARLLAHSARLVRGIVHDRLAELTLEGKSDTPLQQVRREFRDVLYSHPEAAGYSSADFDALFSGAFAQTLAFGLLLVREATGAPVDHHAADHMPPEHPLMRTTLRVLSMEDVAREIGTGFEVMLDTVNGFSPAMLAPKADGKDPILYFYEDFLATFDPKARERYGVYYTPLEVVRFMVGALDRALRENLGADGLADDQVHILDPAAGTGTFLLGIADRLRRSSTAELGAGQALLDIRGLAKRMYGFELLVGPYAVAHYRLHHALARAEEGAPAIAALQRLGVYLTDTLAEPGAAAQGGALDFVTKGIRDERTEANRIKSEQPILAIIGNPPYRRLAVGENETLVGRWMDGLWDDLKAPVRDAHWGNQLNTFPELSIAFWRWAMWKLFEAENAPKRGVVAFITNRKFLTGKPYAGLRKMMRERFDRLEIIDLRGDVRSGERAGVEDDQGVFDIQVGTCVTIAVADGSRPEGNLAAVTYNDSWMHGKISRKAKLDWLTARASAGTLAGGVEVARGALDDFRPLPFFGGQLVNLEACFNFSKSGMKSGNDETYTAINCELLQRKVLVFLSPEPNGDYQSSLERRLSYRPLDTRWLYNDLRRLNRPGPTMQSVWGEANVGLYAMPSGTGAGPGVWCHGLLPDYHAFRGSYGGYAFPLYDRRPGHKPYNLRAELVAALGEAYGAPITPEQVFDAMLALLSAASYTRRFAEDLEDTFPHVPFPSDPAMFTDAAALGGDIREVETFARKPAARFLKGIATLADEPKGVLGAVDWREGELSLCADGSGKLGPVPRPAWDFAVSGYRVLPRWLAARAGVKVDGALTREIRDLVGRIGELIDLFARADSLLAQALDSPLSVATLGVKMAGGAGDA